MWNLMKGKDVMNYGKLQEFVSMLTEAVPGLINHRQRAHLLLGLKARVNGVLFHMQTFLFWCLKVRTTECTFIALVQSLLKDPAERAYFFQEVFPVEYGPQYDSALQVLLWELLSKLEMLLPVPDLKQVYGPSCSIGSCIMSALSVPPSQKTNIAIEQELIHNYANALTPVTLGGAGHFGVVAYCADMKISASEYRSFSGGTFTPSPSSSDEIFTSIKLFPKGNTEQDKVEQDHDSQTHSRQKSLTCKTCGRVFTRTSDVRRHQLTHTGERPFHCSQCDRTFQHSWDLSKHESKHRGVAISFSCQLCGSSFPKLRALTIHHRKSHSQESRLPQICSICSQSSPTASELLEHRKTHTTSKRYPCEQCGEGFDSLLARSQHRRVHRVMRQFKCPHCEKTYTRRSDVKRHLAVHTGERPYQCTQCSKRFPVRFMLTKHLRVHTGERPFQCSHCSKRFTLVSVLARLERMHTGEKPFLCSQCGKGFLSQGELLKHHRSHMDERPYACPQCDKRFKSKTSQQQHTVSHSGTRPYPCTVCGKCFTKPYALTRHNLVHTGERPFPCGHCEKSFLTLSEARLHQRIHTGERPYHCSVCELRFRSSSELARHKRSHSGSKRVTLSREPSGKTFASTAKLKEHMETRDGAEAAPTANSSESCSSVVSRV
uniref:Zinc finger protein 865 n=1 Tax=Nothobranchius furzeri TaxID=105023 RepID=A0A8C6KXZ3_NOTFU